MPKAAHLQKKHLLAAFSATVNCYRETISIVDVSDERKGKRELLYGDLAKEIAAYSRHLQQALGANAGKISLVALNLDPSAEYIVALFSTLLSGAAFLPLPSEIPKDRRTYILNQAKPDLLVSNQSGDLPGPVLGQVTDVDAKDFEDRVRALQVSPDDLAYLLYTSGSTGTPKGVLVPHRGILPLVLHQIAAFGLGPFCHSLLYLSTAFDASLSDIWTTLLSGATLHLEPRSRLRSNALIEILEDRGITHFDIPPALLASMDESHLPPSLTTLIVGGEACPPAVVRRFGRTRRVVNVYGPTEATVCSSLCVCDPNTWDRPLLGKPIPGTFFLVLDEEGREVQKGDSGELYIGGLGLSLGYLGQTALSAAKFPLINGQRLYKTGDQVLYTEEGEWVFLGRLDRQFKLRGQLVEPGEIEAVLCLQNGVTEAAVIRREVQDQTIGSPRVLLCAYVAPRGMAQLEGAIRAQLAEKLPSYLIPSYLEFVDGLPRTLSGKVDYKALGQWPLLQEHDLSLERGDSLSWFSDLRRPSLRTRGNPAQSASVRRDFLARDAEALAFEIPPSPRSQGSDQEPNDFLLTGAAGFFGGHVLGQLLSNPNRRVTCIVRTNQAKERLQTLYPQALLSGCLRVLVGDLAAPEHHLGLAEDVYFQLAEQIDTVFHLAAKVHLLFPYEVLRADNLLATSEILRFCETGRTKHLHHASTLSVAPLLHEADGHLANGYAETKWAAEHLLVYHQGRTAKTLYRLGWLTGPDAPERDLLRGFVDGLVQLRCLPDTALLSARSADLVLDLTPASWAASVLTQLAAAPTGQEAGHPRVVVVKNPQALGLKALVEVLAEIGRPVEILGESEFQERLCQAEPGFSRSALQRGLVRGLFLTRDTWNHLAPGPGAPRLPVCPSAKTALLALLQGVTL